MLRRASLFQPFEFFQFVCDEIESLSKGTLSCNLNHKSYKVLMFDIIANAKTEKHIALHLPLTVAIGFEYDPAPVTKMKDLIGEPSPTVFKIDSLQIMDKTGTKAHIEHFKQVFHMELFYDEIENKQSLMSLMLSVAAGIYFDVEEFLKVLTKSKPATITVDHNWLNKLYAFLVTEISNDVWRTYGKVTHVDEYHAEITLFDKNQGDDDEREPYPVKIFIKHNFIQPKMTADDWSLVLVGDLSDPFLFKVVSFSIVTNEGKGTTQDIEWLGYGIHLLESMKAQNIKEFVKSFTKVITKPLFPLI